MEQMTIQEIAQVTGCAGSYEGIIREISTDSRSIAPGCFFIALRGERFNAHDYIVAALKAGAGWAMAQEHRACYDAFAGRVLYVENTERALMDIARAYRAKFDIRCIGVTGSVGKTTTKDLIAEVVAAGFRTLKTEGNLNNEIGLPKTLLQLDSSHEAAVIEMGMQGRGEIAALAAVVAPGIGVITNIGVSHIEQLGSRENILQAKLELADALPDGAPLVLCGDDDLLAGVRIPRLDVCFYGIENPACDIVATHIKEDLEKTTFTIHYDGKQIEARIPCIGRHNVRNALAAFAVGRALGISPALCAKAQENYMPSGMRQRIVKYHGCTIVEDCYNASPDSMRAALETFSTYPCAGKRIAVLADMLELGEISKQAHTEIGALVAEKKLDLLLTYGDMAIQYNIGAAGKTTKTAHFTNQGALLCALREALAPGDAVWVKGSHGMYLETLLQGLYSEETYRR